MGPDASSLTSEKGQGLRPAQTGCPQACAASEAQDTVRDCGETAQEDAGPWRGVPQALPWEGASVLALGEALLRCSARLQPGLLLRLPVLGFQFLFLDPSLPGPLFRGFVLSR